MESKEKRIRLKAASPFLPLHFRGSKFINRILLPIFLVSLSHSRPQSLSKTLQESKMSNRTSSHHRAISFKTSAYPRKIIYFEQQRPWIIFGYFLSSPPLYTPICLSLSLHRVWAGRRIRARREEEKQGGKQGWKEWVKRWWLQGWRCPPPFFLLSSLPRTALHGSLDDAFVGVRERRANSGKRGIELSKKEERKAGEKGRFSFGHLFPPLVSPARTPRTIFRTRESFGFSKEWKDTRNIPRKSMSDKYVHR